MFNHNNIIYFVVYIYIILEFMHHCCPFCQLVDIDLVVYVAAGAAGGIFILFVIILILCSRQNSSYIAQV